MAGLTQSVANAGTMRTLATPVINAVPGVVQGMHFGPVIAAVAGFVGSMIGIQVAKISSGKSPAAGHDVIVPGEAGSDSWQQIGVDVGEEIPIAEGRPGPQGYSGYEMNGNKFTVTWTKTGHTAPTDDSLWGYDTWQPTTTHYHNFGTPAKPSTHYWASGSADTKRRKEPRWHGFSKDRHFEDFMDIFGDDYIGDDDSGNHLWLRPSIPFSIEPGVPIYPCR